MSKTSAGALSPAPHHRLLIVDDNPAIHDDFRKILGRSTAHDEFAVLAASLFGEEAPSTPANAFDLSFASQGAEALELVKLAVREGRRYSLVFTDVRMPPGWDGLETTLKLWEVDPDLQIVICTAYSDKSWEDVKEKLGHPESVLILKKPFDTIEVLQLAHALTEKWALLQSSRRNLEELENTVDLRTRELQVAHQHLQSSERRYRTLNASAPIGIFESDAAGHWVYANPHWEKLSGLAVSEAQGMGWRKAIHPDDEDWVMQAWVDAVRTGQEFHCEHRYVRPTGEMRWISTRSRVILAESGAIAGHVGTVEDITDQKKTAAALVDARNAALESAQLKSRFLANMSHEIRTPMNGILGMTDLVLETELTREQREYLEMSKTSAQSLLALINDILDFSKIEAGKLDLESIEFGLRDCIGGMLKPLAMRAEQKGLELSADIGMEVPETVIGDPTRLRQILINLIDNAIKFTEHGEVMLRVQFSEEVESCLHFSVEDTGIGIPAAKQAVIFDSFAQADGSTTRTHGGTGLGLAIAVELVKKMGGRMWVESKPGAGTTFHFTAPLPLKESPLLPAIDEARELAGLRAMVVDNNPTNRRIVGGMLANWQMRPTLVGTASAALDELARAARNRNPFAVVIIDAAMPELDGFALAARIQEHPNLNTARVMMLPSAPPQGAVARCTALGISGILTKPVAQAELLGAILLSRSTPRAVRPAPAPEPANPARRGLRILLAEDNTVNRALAAGILEKRGHELIRATNGREALEASRDPNIDLILMDVQMPEMDGFEATRCIRDEQEKTGRHVPIVAMTAHAMAGDRERCLEAGMDDYLSKPLQKELLLKLVDRVTSHTEARPAAKAASATMRETVSAPAPAKDEPPFDREALYERFDGDQDTLREVASLFARDTPRFLKQIHEGISHRCPAPIMHAAHTLLSTFGALGAHKAHELTRRLEDDAAVEDYASLAAIHNVLGRESAKIQVVLDELWPECDVTPSAHLMLLPVAKTA